MYRVKEVGGIFIPQKLSWFTWDGLDLEEKHLWFNHEYQYNYCACVSLEKARERIKSYKIQVKTPKVKYHYGKQ